MRINRAAKLDRLALELASFRNRYGWRPIDGLLSAARRLERRGLLAECGTCSMPPYVLYSITEAGRAALSTDEVPK